ncbi:MAG: hypothetical protein AB1899_06050 [Pseudomonadota bacterium]
MAQHNSQLAPANTLQSTRVSKRFNPGDKGTKRLLAQFGDSLVCMRYRFDDHKRYPTVELVVDEQAQIAPPRKDMEIIGVSIDYKERELRGQAKQAGATWNDDLRLWLMARSVAKSLGIEDRIQPLTKGFQ